jgi:hypothetical protein
MPGEDGSRLRDVEHRAPATPTASDLRKSNDAHGAIDPPRRAGVGARRSPGAATRGSERESRTSEAARRQPAPRVEAIEERR